MPTSSAFEECDALLQTCINEAARVFNQHHYAEAKDINSFLQGRYSYYSNCRHFAASTLARVKEASNRKSNSTKNNHRSPKSPSSHDELNTNTNTHTTSHLHLLERSSKYFEQEFQRDCSFILNENHDQLMASKQNDNDDAPRSSVITLPAATLPDSRGSVGCLLYKWKSPVSSRLFHRVAQRCLDDSVQLMLPAPFHASGFAFPSCRIAFEGTYISVIILPPLLQTTPIMSTSTSSSSSSFSPQNQQSLSTSTGCGIFALRTFAAALSPLQYPSTLDAVGVLGSNSSSSIPPTLLLPAVSAYSCWGSNEFIILPDKISTLSQILDDPTSTTTSSSSSSSPVLLRPELQEEAESCSNSQAQLSQLLDRKTRKVALHMIDYFNSQIQQTTSTSSSTMTTETDSSIINITLARNELSSSLFHPIGINIKLMYFVICHLESLLATERPLDSRAINIAKKCLGAEMIARAIKSLVRKRIEAGSWSSSSSSTSFIQTTQEIFNDFLSDKIYYREKIQPTMRQKFGAPESFFVDRESLTPLLGGIASLVARGLGCSLEKDMKTFICNSSSCNKNASDDESSSGDYFSPQKLYKISSSAVVPNLTNLMLPGKNQDKEEEPSPTSSSSSASPKTLQEVLSGMSPRNPHSLLHLVSQQQQRFDMSNISHHHSNNNTSINRTSIVNNNNNNIPPPHHHPNAVAVGFYLEAARILKYCFRETVLLQNRQQQRGNTDIILGELTQRMKRNLSTTSPSTSPGSNNNTTNSLFSSPSRYSQHQLSPSFVNNNNNSTASSSSTILEQKSRQQQQRLRRTLSVWILSCVIGTTTPSKSSTTTSATTIKNLVSEFVVIFRPDSSSPFESMSSLFCALTMMKRVTSGTATVSTTNFSMKEKADTISSSIPELLLFVSRCGKELEAQHQNKQQQQQQQKRTNENEDDNNTDLPIFSFPKSPFSLQGRNYNILLQDQRKQHEQQQLLSHSFFQCLETCSMILDSISSSSSNNNNTSSSSMLSPSRATSFYHQHQPIDSSTMSNTNNGTSFGNSSVSSSSSNATLLVTPGLCSYLWNILLWNLRAGTELKKIDNENDKKLFAGDDEKNNNTVLMTNSSTMSSPNSYIGHSRMITASDRSHLLSSPTGRDDNNKNHQHSEFSSSSLLGLSPMGSSPAPTAFDEREFWAVGLDIVFFQPIFSLKIPSLVAKKKNSIIVATGGNSSFSGSSSSSWWQEYCLFALTTIVPQLVNLPIGQVERKREGPTFNDELLTRILLILVGIAVNNSSSSASSTTMINNNNNNSDQSQQQQQQHLLDSEITTLASLLDPTAAKVLLLPATVMMMANNNHNNSDEASSSNDHNNTTTTSNGFEDISKVIDYSRQMILTPRQRQQQRQQQKTSFSSTPSSSNTHHHNDPYRAVLSESLRIVLFSASALPFELNAPKFSRFIVSSSAAVYRCTLDHASHHNNNNGNTNNGAASLVSLFVQSPTTPTTTTAAGSPVRSIQRQRQQNLNGSTTTIISSTTPHHQKVRNLLVEYSHILENSVSMCLSSSSSSSSSNVLFYINDSLFSLWKFWKKMITNAVSDRSLLSLSQPFVFEMEKYRESADAASQNARNQTEEEVSDRMVIEAEENLARKKMEKEVCVLNDKVYRSMEADALQQERNYAAINIQHSLRLRKSSSSSQVVSEKRRQLSEKQQLLQQQVLEEERNYAALKIQTIQRQKAARAKLMSQKQQQQFAATSTTSGAEVHVQEQEREFATVKLQSVARKTFAKKRTDDMRELRLKHDRELYERDSPDRQHHHAHFNPAEEEELKKHEVVEEEHEQNDDDHHHHHGGALARIHHNEEDHEKMKQEKIEDDPNEVRSALRERNNKHHLVSFDAAQEEENQEHEMTNSMILRGHHGGSIAYIRHTEEEENRMVDRGQEVRNALINSFNSSTRKEEEDEEEDDDNEEPVPVEIDDGNNNNNMTDEIFQKEKIELSIEEAEARERQELAADAVLGIHHPHHHAHFNPADEEELKKHEEIDDINNNQQNHHHHHHHGGTLARINHNEQDHQHLHEQKIDDEPTQVRCALKSERKSHLVSFDENQEEENQEHEMTNSMILRGHHGGSIAYIRHTQEEEETFASQGEAVRSALMSHHNENDDDDDDLNDDEEAVPVDIDDDISNNNNDINTTMMNDEFEKEKIALSITESEERVRHELTADAVFEMRDIIMLKMIENDVLQNQQHQQSDRQHHHSHAHHAHFPPAEEELKKHEVVEEQYERNNNHHHHHHGGALARIHHNEEDHEKMKQEKIEDDPNEVRSALRERNNKHHLVSFDATQEEENQEHEMTNSMILRGHHGGSIAYIRHTEEEENKMVDRGQEVRNALINSFNSSTRKEEEDEEEDDDNEEPVPVEIDDSNNNNNMNDDTFEKKKISLSIAEAEARERQELAAAAIFGIHMQQNHHHHHHHAHFNPADEEELKKHEEIDDINNNQQDQHHHHGGTLARITHSEQDHQHLHEQKIDDEPTQVRCALKSERKSHLVSFDENQEEENQEHEMTNSMILRGHHGGSIAYIRHTQEEEETFASQGEAVRSALMSSHQNENDDDDDDLNDDEEAISVVMEDEEEARQQELLFATIKIQSTHRQNAARNRSNRMRNLKALCTRKVELFESEERVDRDEVERQEMSGAAALRMQNKMMKKLVAEQQQQSQQQEQQQQQRHEHQHHHVHFNTEQQSSAASNTEQQQSGHGGSLAFISHNQHQEEVAADHKEEVQSALNNDINHDCDENQESADSSSSAAAATAALRIQSAQRQRQARIRVNNIRSLKVSAAEQQKIFIGEEQVARREVLLDECSGFASMRMLMQVVASVQSESDFDRLRKLNEENSTTSKSPLSSSSSSSRSSAGTAEGGQSNRAGVHRSNYFDDDDDSCDEDQTDEKDETEAPGAAESVTEVPSASTDIPTTSNEQQHQQQYNHHATTHNNNTPPSVDRPRPQLFQLPPLPTTTAVNDELLLQERHHHHHHHQQQETLSSPISETSSPIYTPRGVNRIIKGVTSSIVSRIQSENDEIQRVEQQRRSFRELERDVLELLDLEEEMRKSIEDCEVRMKRFMRLPGGNSGSSNSTGNAKRMSVVIGGDTSNTVVQYAPNHE